MKLALPQYNGKDNLVMLLILLPYTLVINGIMFGRYYTSSMQVFLLTTFLTALASVVHFVICGMIAVALRNRFPLASTVMKRLSVMIGVFLILSGLYLFFLFHAYEKIPWIEYSFNENNFTYGYFALGIINIFLSFLMEGISRYYDWKKSWEENQQLTHAYKQGQLQGLKSQVSPHFLFNSLNSLSSLIQEDAPRAERFLDEMSKVYRYMLQHEDEQLVSLGTELIFIHAYVHLLEARYGNGLRVHTDIEERHRGGMLAPLSLQVIIEQAFSRNVISKTNPLEIHISYVDEQIWVTHDIRPKAITEAIDIDARLENLLMKYQLMNMPIVIDESNTARRTYQIPVIKNHKEVLL